MLFSFSTDKFNVYNLYINFKSLSKRGPKSFGNRALVRRMNGGSSSLVEGSTEEVLLGKCANVGGCEIIHLFVRIF